MRVIKISGRDLDNPGFVAALGHALMELQEPAVLVHGGGKAIDNFQRRLGIETVKANGLRVTDNDSLGPTLMVLSGLVNKTLTAGLIQAGIDAVGLSGVDGGLLRCSKHTPDGVDLGFVGTIDKVREDILLNLIQNGQFPVVSPMSLSHDGQIMNVNADEAASAIASALNADVLDFVSNVPGVLANNQLLPALTREEAQSLIEDGTIHSGMIPKIQAAFAALEIGVQCVRIVDLNGFARKAGTVLSQRPFQIAACTSEVLK